MKPINIHKEEVFNHLPFSPQAVDYGYGVFETLCAVKGKLLYPKEHYERMLQSCQTLDLKMETSLKQWMKASEELMGKTPEKFTVVKWVVSYAEPQARAFVQKKKYPYVSKQFIEGFGLKISRNKRNPQDQMTFHKTNNYMGNFIEKKKAKEEGYDEVIFLNTDNHLTEGSMSNLFWIKQEKLYTPRVKCGLLKGIMRQNILSLCEEEGWAYEEGHYGLSCLLEADAVFISNSLLGIMPVSSVGERKYKGKSTQIFQNIESHFKWLEEVKNGL